MSIVYLIECLIYTGAQVLAFGAYVFVLLWLLSFTFISWRLKWSFWKWVFSIVSMLYVLLGASFVGDALSREAGTHALKEPLQEKELVGAYVLEADTVIELKKSGYANHEAKITLNADHTFEITKMPHRWLTSDFIGYDDCYGTWKVEKISGRSTDTIVLSLDRFSSTSAFHHDKGWGDMGSAIVDIFGKTKENPHYGIGLPINNGDGGGLAFKKLNHQ